MMAANYRYIGGGENRLGRHYSRFSGIWPTAFLADQSLALRKSQNGGSNRRRRARSEPDGGATVRILLDRRKRAVDTCKLLVGRKERAGLVVVDREGPEVLRGSVPARSTHRYGRHPGNSRPYRGSRPRRR